MAKLRCHCGQLLSSHPEPSDIIYWVYTDEEFESIKSQSEINTIDIPFPKYEVWRCKKCNRIYVFEDNKPMKIYIEETTK